MKIRVKPFAPFLMAWLLTGLLWAQSVPLNEGARKYLEKELQPQLYNLENDISETDNLIEEYPIIHKNLQSSPQLQ